MQLVITGWKPGIKRISLLDLVRQHNHWGLKAGKEAVDGLLDGKEIVIECKDEAQYFAVRQEVERLGAICR